MTISVVRLPRPRLPAVARCVEGDCPKPGYGAVYALIDPRNSSVRYIGKTTGALSARLHGHLHSKNDDVREWVRELAAAGRRPSLRVIRHVPAADLDVAERETIADFAMAGWPLLNRTGIPAQATTDPEVAAQRARRAQSMDAAAADWAEAERQRLVQAELDRGCAATASAALFAVAQRVSGGPAPPPIEVLADADATGFPETLIECLPGLGVRRPTNPERNEVARQIGAFVQGWAYRNGVVDSRPDGYAMSRPVHQLADHLRVAMYHADEIPELSARERHWRSPSDMLKVVALAAWHEVAVMPWVLAAREAKLPSTGAAFADLVSDDPHVRAALEAWDAAPWHPETEELEFRYMDPVQLYAIVVPYAEGDLRVIADDAAQRVDMKSTFAELGRVKGLTRAAAAMFHRIDPDAVTRTLGSDILSTVDGRLAGRALTAGTARTVLEELAKTIQGTRLDDRPEGSYDALKYLASLVAPRELPTVPSPFWLADVMHTMRVKQTCAAFAALVARGVAATPELDPVQIVNDSIQVWFPRARRSVYG